MKLKYVSYRFKLHKSQEHTKQIMVTEVRIVLSLWGDVYWEGARQPS